MSVFAKRLGAIEKHIGAGSCRPPAVERFWACYARIGHEEEDVAEAARLAGVVVGENEQVFVGIMSPAEPTHWPIPPMFPYRMGAPHLWPPAMREDARRAGEL